MRRRAAKVDANQGEIVEALRAAGVTVWITSWAGQGFPDIIAYRKSTGLLRLIEIKNGALPPSKRKLTKDEAEFAALFPVWVVKDVVEAMAAMEVT